MIFESGCTSFSTMFICRVDAVRYWQHHKADVPEGLFHSFVFHYAPDTSTEFMMMPNGRM
jgi:hypothetical protein